jgi:transposase
MRVASHAGHYAEGGPRRPRRAGASRRPHPATGEVSTRRLHGPPSSRSTTSPRPPGTTAVYEASPTGFTLDRAAAERGLDFRVVAPGLLPRKAGDRAKTDRRDALRLARLLAAGELSFCRVPSVEEERFRDLVRAREDLRADLVRARHRLSKLLLRQASSTLAPGSRGRGGIGAGWR